MKRLMTNGEMLELLDASEEDIRALRAATADIGLAGTPEWLVRAQVPRTEKVTTFRANGEKFAVVWSWVSPGNQTLVVNALASLVPGDVMDLIMRGLHQLADLRHCARLQFTTRRRGLVEKMLDRGFDIEGVTMSKTIAPVM
jgi:hypothetical protein